MYPGGELFGIGRAAEAFGSDPEAYAAVQGDRTKQLIAQMLLARGMQQPQGQMVGRFYVPPSPWQHLGNLAQVGLGVGVMNAGDQKRVEMANEIRKRKAAEIEAFKSQMAPVPEVPPSHLPQGTPPTYQDSNLSEIIDQTGAFQAVGTPSVRPDSQSARNLVIDSMLDSRLPMPVPPSSTPPPMEYRPPVMTDPGMPPTQGPISPGTPARERTGPEQQANLLNAMTSFDNPVLRDTAKFIAQQQQAEEMKKMQNDLTLALTGIKQKGAETLEEKKAAGAQQLKATVSGDAVLSQAGQNTRTDLAKVQQISDLLQGLDPNSLEAKVLRDLQAKLSTHGAASSTTVNVDQGTPFVTELQKKTAGQVSDTHEAALTAQKSLGTITLVEDAIKTGKVVTGPSATPQVYLRQLGDVLGVGGKDNAEVLTNTRKAIQGMAQLQIDMSRQAQGQGAISDYERKLFEKASAGTDLTNVEITELLQGMKKVAHFTIALHQRNIGLIKKLPRGGEVLAPFMELQGIGATETPSQPSTVAPSISDDELLRKYQ